MRHHKGSDESVAFKIIVRILGYGFMGSFIWAIFHLFTGFYIFDWLFGDRDFSRLEEQYSISIVTDGVSWFRVRGYAPILIREFSLYPPALVRASGLKEIRLHEGGLYTSRAGRRCRVAGLARSGGIDVDMSGGDVIFSPRVIHHEFFHVLDINRDSLYADPEWEGLNPYGFKYSAKHENRWWPIVGFISEYAMTKAREDKAETFAYLMTDYSYMKRRARRDPIVAKKIRLMRERLKGMSPSMSASMSPEFWQGLERRSLSISLSISTTIGVVIQPQDLLRLLLDIVICSLPVWLVYETVPWFDVSRAK